MTQKDRQYEQLTAYLDGELGEAQRAEVERLLARDAAARRVLDELRATSRMVGGLPRTTAPRGLSAEITARLEREALLGDAPVLFDAGPRRMTPIWQRGLAIAVALAIIVTGSWLMWPELPKPPSERPVITVADADSPHLAAEEAESEPPSRLLKEERVALAAKPQAVPGAPGAMAEPMSLRQAGQARESSNEPVGAVDAGESDLAAPAYDHRNARAVPEIAAVSSAESNHPLPSSPSAAPPPPAILQERDEAQSSLDNSTMVAKKATSMDDDGEAQLFSADAAVEESPSAKPWRVTVSLPGGQGDTKDSTAELRLKIEAADEDDSKAIVELLIRIDTDVTIDQRQSQEAELKDLGDTPAGPDQRESANQRKPDEHFQFVANLMATGSWDKARLGVFLKQLEELAARRKETLVWTPDDARARLNSLGIPIGDEAGLPTTQVSTRKANKINATLEIVFRGGDNGESNSAVLPTTQSSTQPSSEKLP